MIYKKSQPVSPLNIILSILFLCVVLSTLYNFRGEPRHANAYFDLANLKSIMEEGQARRYGEPLPAITTYYWKNITGLNYLLAYKIYLSILYSVFLHLCMLIFRKEIWKLNHYFLLYLIAFSPLSVNLPFQYSGELLCLIIIQVLYIYSRLETFIDLIVMSILTILGFLSNFVMFLVVFSVYITVYCIKEMRQTRITVFYKKKNIPLTVLLAYGGFMVSLIVVLGSFEFFGSNSFQFLFIKVRNILIQFVPIFLLILFTHILLEKEKELTNRKSLFVVIVLIGISVYFSYNHKGSLNTEKMIQQGRLLTSLRTKVMKPEQKVYGSATFSDIVYFFYGEKIEFNHISEMQKDDFLIVNGLNQETASSINKGFKTKDTLFISLDTNSVLVNKEFMQRIYNSDKYSAVKEDLLKSIQDFYQPTPYDKMKKIMTDIISLSIVVNEV
ncbi:MAG: hypothetical protein H7A23_19760 [Leptospiraceae bacterium]|nr:hypothetical protein [Leptospiraceae bacterium]MCP5496793.1 hypothetical protein [Leptospiraceae bacterium]